MTLSKHRPRSSLKHFLLSVPQNQELWVFGYGSLMWDPGFSYEEKLLVYVSGYQRSFCIKSISYRGTPENPGLVLGLEQKSQRCCMCYGLAFRINQAQVTTTIQDLWAREMLTHVYKPTFVRVSSQTQSYQALTFVADPNHSDYCGHMSIDQAAQKILGAKGLKGNNLSYLEATFHQLRHLNIHDSYIHNMLCAVYAMCRETTQKPGALPKGPKCCV